VQTSPTRPPAQDARGPSSKLETTDITRHFSAPSEKSQIARREAEKNQLLLITRLEKEGEQELADTLWRCRDTVQLRCLDCGTTRQVWQGCRQKWCPVCVRRLATARVAKFRVAVEAMEWPLFCTFTVPHTVDSDAGDLRLLRRGFGRLRHTKLWKKNVIGGVAGIEVTNQGGGWHPHLHTVIDCRWLAWKTPRPQRGETKRQVREKCLAASDELGLAWARALRVRSLDPAWCGVIFKVKRCDPHTIGPEVLKYSVKGSDLANARENPGDLIRLLKATRLVTSFGSLFGDRRLRGKEKLPACPCGKCGGTSWMTQYEEDAHMRDHARTHRRGRK
jgi:hypothetical protein